MKGKLGMLRNIQIKIVLIFLIIGIIAIAAMGYINYANLERVIQLETDNIQELGEVIQKYQGQVKIITLFTVLTFSTICVLVRSVCNTKNNFSNNKINK